MSFETDVLVVGAGPTGLVAASELAKRGVRCRIVDHARGRSDKSRALALQPRSLEVLQRMGALGDLLDLGQRSLSFNVHLDGRAMAGATIDRIDFDGTPFPFLLFVSQAETERVLDAHASSVGLRVEWETELVALRERGDGVEAELATPKGGEVVRARYVVGADGAHSVVRKSAGLRFEGDVYPQDFVLADVDVEWPYPHGSLHLFFSSRGLCVFLPMRGERAYRVITALGEGGASEVPTLDEVRGRAREATGLEIDLRNPRWLARFRLHHRGVDRYRSGRIFVAGDAAHIHSPAGGQGMNTGIQDAFNLAWKLALVVAGHAPDELLDSYHAERHPVGRNLLRFTDRIFRLGSSDNSVIAGLRRLAIPIGAPFVLHHPGRRARAFRFISELAIHYRGSPLTEEPRRRGSLGRQPAAGSRAPDATLGATSLFERMRGTGFHLLCFERSDRRIEPTSIDAVGLVTPLRIHGAPANRAGSTRGDANDDAFRRYGVTDAGLYLIRPDGYIAMRVPGTDVTPIREFLRRHGIGRPVPAGREIPGGNHVARAG